MIKINGKILSETPFNGQKLIQHLVEYNQPIASLFEYDGKYFIWWWLDVDDISNRWGVVRTTKDKLEIWKESNFDWVGFKDVIETKLGYIINLDNDGEFIVGWEVDVSEIINYE